MAGTLPRPGVVVVSDIDLDLPDARRTHTLEVTRWLARLGFVPDLVSRGADPALDGVRYHAARPGEGTRERLVRVNRRAIGVLRAPAADGGRAVRAARLGDGAGGRGRAPAGLPRRRGGQRPAVRQRRPGLAAPDR